MATQEEEARLRGFQIPEAQLSPQRVLRQGPVPGNVRPTTTRNSSGPMAIISGLVVAAAQLVVGGDERDYLIIQNTSTLYNLLVGFGDFSTASAVPNRAFTIFPGLAYEPLVAPNSDIWLAGNINGVTFTVGYIVSCH